MPVGQRQHGGDQEEARLNRRNTKQSLERTKETPEYVRRHVDVLWHSTWKPKLVWAENYCI